MSNELVQGVKDSGIKEITPAVENKNFSVEFKKAMAGSRVEMCFLTGVTMILNHSPAIVEMLRRNVKVHLLFSDITSPIWDTEKEEKFINISEGLCPGTPVKHNALWALNLVSKDILNLLSEEERSNLEIGLSTAIVTAHCVILHNVNNENICYYTPYLPHTHSQKSARFAFSEKEKLGFSLIAQSFHEMWENRLKVKIEGKEAEVIEYSDAAGTPVR